MVSQLLSDILRCPGRACGGSLASPSGELRCARCGAGYPVIDGIPVLLAPRALADEFRRTEAKQWDDQASAYEETRSRDLVYMAGVLAAVRNLRIRAGDRVLDAGCGTGFTVREYHRSGVETVALDLSLDSLRQLRRCLPEANGVHLVCGDLTTLPFAGDVFDRVVCANALQHLPDSGATGEAVAERARVARPGAPVVVTVHNYSIPKRRAGWEREGASGGHSGGVQWIHRFDRREFERLLARELRVRKVVGAGLPLVYRFKLTPVMRIVERLWGWFPASAPWGNMLIGVTERRRATPSRSAP